MTFLDWVYSQGIEHKDLFWAKAAWEQSAKVTKEKCEMARDDYDEMRPGWRKEMTETFVMGEEPKTVNELIEDLTKLVLKKLDALAEENQRLFDRVSDLEAKVDDVECKVDDIDGESISDFLEKVESLETDLEDLKDTLRNV